MARLILDTGVIIAGARRALHLEVIADDDDVAIPAIAVAEYLTGVILDTDPGRSAAQQAYLEAVLEVVPIQVYDHRVAHEHADLLAHLQRIGEPRGAHDLIIAATARASDRVVVTTDERARFGDLPDVRERLIGRHR